MTIIIDFFRWGWKDPYIFGMSGGTVLRHLAIFFESHAGLWLLWTEVQRVSSFLRTSLDNLGVRSVIFYVNLQSVMFFCRIL